jgi:hypothetical protein
MYRAKERVLLVRQRCRCSVFLISISTDQKRLLLALAEVVYRAYPYQARPPTIPTIPLDHGRN